MNQEQLTDDLNQLLASITRSLLAHLHKAQPYVTAATYRIGADLDRMNQANQRHAVRLAELLDRMELPEHPKTFLPEVAYYHFVGLPTLLPVLIREKTQHVELCRRALDHAQAAGGTPADVLEELHSLLAENQDELTRLQQHAQTLGLDKPATAPDKPAPASAAG